MTRSVLIKLGANYVAEIERDDAQPQEGARLTLYRLEVTDGLSQAQAEALAAALAPGGELPRP